MERKVILLRVTLQALAPLMIASGEEDALHDVLLVRDPNDLPTIPATSIAGALRARIGDRHNDWFGSETPERRQRSAVTFTDGLFHWSDNLPRDGMVLGEARAALARDPLCREVLGSADPVMRQHVRLSAHGVVDGSGKFTRSAVPAGARFTFEVRTSLAEAADEIERLVKAGIWLGGATRSGYGQMACVALGREDLTLPRDMARWTAIVTKDIGTESAIRTRPVEGSKVSSTWTIGGRIEGTLLIGAESGTLEEDRVPWREPRIQWTGDRGSFQRNCLVVPGTSIKGPIRHRTLFHLRRLKVAHAEEVNDDLFGSVASEAGGAAGKLRFHDAPVDDVREIVQTHVGLDRFTGGARRGVLFTDRMLWQPQLAVRIDEITPGSLSLDQRLALAATMEDLRRGLLGIGAEWGEGAGIFGTIETFVIPDIGDKAEAGNAA
jgi:CRISPR/Cas system CSM-associated protein Csm3 (group 7 of RAMP superfamily)